MEIKDRIAKNNEENAGGTGENKLNMDKNKQDQHGGLIIKNNETSIDMVAIN